MFFTPYEYTAQWHDIPPQWLLGHITQRLFSNRKFSLEEKEKHLEMRPRVPGHTNCDISRLFHISTTFQIILLHIKF